MLLEEALENLRTHPSHLQCKDKMSEGSRRIIGLIFVDLQICFPAVFCSVSQVSRVVH